MNSKLQQILEDRKKAKSLISNIDNHLSEFINTLKLENKDILTTVYGNCDTLNERLDFYINKREATLKFNVSQLDDLLKPLKLSGIN